MLKTTSIIHKGSVIATFSKNRTHFANLDGMCDNYVDIKPVLEVHFVGYSSWRTVCTVES